MLRLARHAEALALGSSSDWSRGSRSNRRDGGAAAESKQASRYTRAILAESSAGPTLEVPMRRA